ncbi:hypothetical protein SELSPUOL_00705 [Selenomonas sputigena ATCC 35185]|uniref:Uncharacterized protein n=1 Tax=Selenomonas sputigena (strain ATCC 35185 / DSM 20758 / CCUG 44933 / VPI D19B-28) TaxID=546271 RepID=C9LTC2_SELS3|nr:hypothetical protein SELSPUOL_00705 [Selenomonas sputigena ATCC 35185]
MFTLYRLRYFSPLFSNGGFLCHNEAITKMFPFLICDTRGAVYIKMPIK